MATKSQTIEQALIDSACERVRERLSAGEAEQVEEFVRQYYRWVASDDLVDRSPLDVYGAALAHWNFAGAREPGAAKVRVYNPEFEQHGWQSTHTVIEVVCDDMPFLVDSVSMEVNRLNYRIHLALHPVVAVERDDAGKLAGIVADSGGQAESMMHLEVDRQADPGELQALERNLQRVLGDVRDAVADWPAMREKVAGVIRGGDGTLCGWGWLEGL